MFTFAENIRPLHLIHDNSDAIARHLMDSLTQIILGAAVGEVVLGKKVGNRAMVWGAVAGTIPDLDIIGNLFMNEMDALAFHRGISHSIFFAVLMAPLLGWLVHKFYLYKVDQHYLYKGIISILGGLFSFALLWLVIGLPISNGKAPIPLLSILILLLVGWLFYRLRVYHKNPLSRLGESASVRDWSWLFFWGVFTHPLLDCFTTYGTQVFQPFSNYRVAFNTISVADPIYTVPFLICLIAASMHTRDHAKRGMLNLLGIGLSSAYLLFAVFNKFHVNQQFEQSLAKYELPYDRYMTSPAILNNVLWTAVAESNDKFYYGTYSLMDKQQYMDIDSLYKGHYLLAPHKHQEDIATLKWFSDGYYKVAKAKDGQLILNDLRFGVIGNLEEPKDTTKFVFQFFLSGEGDQFRVTHERDVDQDFKKEFGKLWTRIKGI